MTLYAVDPGPLPPSYQELADAILNFSQEFYSVFSNDQAMPADLPLLQLAERIIAARPETRVAGRTGSEG